jgi:hypothetical protein
MYSFFSVRNMDPLKLLLASAGYLLGLLFYPEDGSDMLLRNVGLPPNYTPLQPRRALVKNINYL